MGPGAHPVFIWDNVQECRFPTQLFEECQFGSVRFRRRGQLPILAGCELHTHFCRLHPRRVAEKVSKRDRVRDFVLGIRIVVYSLNALAENFQRPFHALPSESSCLRPRHEIPLLRDSPFSTLAGRFYVALKLKGRDRFLCFWVPMLSAFAKSFSVQVWIPRVCLR